jgi:hypothetical protein
MKLNMQPIKLFSRYGIIEIIDFKQNQNILGLEEKRKVI